MNLLKLLIGIILILCLSFVMIARLQAEETKHTTSGTVLSVVDDHIAIKSQDGPQYNIQEQIFQVSGHTLYKNILSLNELKREDQVDITYEENVGNKIALTISKTNKAESHAQSTSQNEWDPSVKKQF